MSLRMEVRQAAMIMDKEKPDWYEHIDPITLDMTDSDDCVCGQNGLVWGDLFWGCHYDLRYATSDPETVPLWLEEIAVRRKQAALELEPALASRRA